MQANVTKQISEGNFDVEIVPASADDTFSIELSNMKNNINEILVQIEALIKDVLDGKLNSKADEEGFNGKWKTFITDLNKLIKAFVEPIDITADYIEKISSGSIPEKLTEEYRGDFNTIKNNLNTCIDVMESLISETSMIESAVKNGNLSSRGNASKFSGSWAEIVKGLNNILV